MSGPDPMGPTLLAYAGTAVLVAFLAVGIVGALCVIGEALARLARRPWRR